MRASTQLSKQVLIFGVAMFVATLAMTRAAKPSEDGDAARMGRVLTWTITFLAVVAGLQAVVSAVDEVG